MSFNNSQIYKARKVHKCDLCRQLINIGEKYNRQAGVNDGDFYDVCFHLHCENIISSYCAEDGDYEYTNDGVIDWMSDRYCYDCKQKEDCDRQVLRCEIAIKDFKPPLKAQN